MRRDDDLRRSYRSAIEIAASLRRDGYYGPGVRGQAHREWLQHAFVLRLFLAWAEGRRYE